MDIDLTLLIQLSLFLGLLLTLGSLLFKPYLRVIQQRHARIVDAGSEAEALLTRSGHLRSEYEQKLQIALHKAQARREESRTQAKEDEQRLVARARQEAGERVARQVSQVTAQRDTLQGELDAERSELAAAVASRLLGRPVQ